MPENPIYKFLQENNLTTKDENSFVEEYSKPENSAKLHQFLQENNLTKKSKDEFYNEYFAVKKKEEPPSTSGGAYVRPLSQGAGEPAQSFSEATLGRLSDDQFRARKEAETNRQKAIEKEQARVRKEQFYSNVKPIAQSTAEDIDLFAPNNSLPSTGEIYQTLKQIEINKAKGFQYKPKPITQPLASDVTKTTITPRLTATLSEEERNRQLALKAKEKEEETSLTETKEEATPLQKTLTLASNVAKGAIGVGRDFAQVGDLLIRKGIENTFEGEPKKYKPEVQGIIDRVRGYNLQRGDEAFEKDLGQYFYEHPEYKKSDAAQTARGLGQVIPSVVVGLLTGGTGVFAQTAIQGTLSGTQIFNEAYKRAKEYGTDDETAIKTAFLDAVGESYIDAFPTLKLLNRFNKTVGGGFWNKAKQSAKEVGIAFVEGGTSEGLQKIVSNAIASYNYDDNVALLDDVFEEGKIGGFTQSLLSLGLSAIKHARVKAKTPQQKAELDKKEASLYDAMKSQNIASPPMEGKTQPPAEGGAPSPTPPASGTTTAVKEEAATPQGEVTAEEKAVTPQGEEPLVEGNTPEEIATNIQVKLDDIKTQRADILKSLPTDESGKRIKNAEAQAQLDDLEEQELKLQEYDSQNKQRVSGQVGEGQKPVETQPVGAGGEEAVAPSGVFQTPTQEVIIPDTPAAHVTAVMDNPTTTNVQNLADNAVSLAQEVIKQGNDQGTIPQEKMPTLEETKPVVEAPKVEMPKIEAPKVEEAKASVVGGEKSILNSDTDLKGDEKDEFMLPVTYTQSKRVGDEVQFVNSQGEQMTGNYRGTNTEGKAIIDRPQSKDGKKYNLTSVVPESDVTFPKYEDTGLDKGSSDAIKYAIENDLYTNAISEGRMTATDAVKIIESAGLKVPKDISEQSLKETSVAEAPKTEPTEALKDVESTAKALEGVIGKKVKRETNEIIINLEKKLKKTELERTNYLLEGKRSITTDENLKNEISELKKQIFNEENKLALIRKDNLQKMIDSNQLKTAIENNLITAENARLETIGNGIEVPSWLQKIVDSNKAKKEIATDSILNRTTDFLGKEKMEFMIPKTDPSVITKDIVDYLVGHVKRAIENGKYENAIAEGRMTAKDAKTIIESYGLKVPSKIQQLLGKPTEAPKTEAKPSEVTKEPTPSKIEVDYKEQLKAEFANLADIIASATGARKNFVDNLNEDQKNTVWRSIKNISTIAAKATGKKGKELVQEVIERVKELSNDLANWLEQNKEFASKLIAPIEPTNIRIFEELDVMNEKRMGVGERTKQNKAYNEKHGDQAQLARDITKNYKKYIDKLQEEGIIVKIKC